ncbi:hypothetical protein BpHYR1_021369 [Brachionus plicatilis]|uniref:Uncharacterized protein n=1 Tax=Brachionus plicatilis TaxID=10195 RepID=A0A3M7Q7G5_BRAPC|nr:hypothetical protein BpHYR1_021369 [Brachionus plicatilis]
MPLKLLNLKSKITVKVQNILYTKVKSLCAIIFSTRRYKKVDFTFESFITTSKNGLKNQFLGLIVRNYVFITEFYD